MVKSRTSGWQVSLPLPTSSRTISCSKHLLPHASPTHRPGVSAEHQWVCTSSNGTAKEYIVCCYRICYGVSPSQAAGCVVRDGSVVVVTNTDEEVDIAEITAGAKLATISCKVSVARVSVMQYLDLQAIPGLCRQLQR